MKTRTTTIRIKPKNRNILTVLAVIILLSFLLRIPTIAGEIAKVLKIDQDKVSNIGKATFYIALGTFLILSGISLLTSPVVAICLIAVGAAMVVITLVNQFSKSKIEVE